MKAHHGLPCIPGSKRPASLPKTKRPTRFSRSGNGDSPESGEQHFSPDKENSYRRSPPSLFLEGFPLDCPPRVLTRKRLSELFDSSSPRLPCFLNQPALFPDLPSCLISKTGSALEFFSSSCPEESVSSKGWSDNSRLCTLSDFGIVRPLPAIEAF